MIKIRSRWSNKVIYTSQQMSLRAAVIEAVASGSDLSGSDLRHSDLSGSNLRGSNLRGSDLRHSDLRHSDLSSSDLSGSDLRYSDITRAVLCDCNLHNARITYRGETRLVKLRLKKTALWEAGSTQPRYGMPVRLSVMIWLFR